jgi:hypothetical protein
MAEPHVCSNCGAGFVDNAAFCVQCGAPRHVVFTAPPVQGAKRSTSRTWLLSGAGLLVIAVVVIGAYAAFTWLTPPDQPSASLPANGTLNGRLRNAGDVHRYEFSAQAGTRTTIEVRSTGDLEPSIGLIGVDFDSGLTPWDNDTGITRITWFNQEAKELRVRVAGASNSKGTYTLVVTTSAPSPITSGQKSSLDFPVGYSAAEYGFDASAGQRATVVLDPNGAAAGASRALWVTDSDGNYIDGWSSTDAYPVVLDWRVPEAGHYVVTAAVLQESSDEHELMLSVADAIALAVDTIVDGNVDSTTPIVDYVFNADDGLYSATIDGSDALNAQIDIVDDDDYVLASSSTNGGFNDSGYARLESGEYHVLVKALENSHGSFSLTLSRGEAGTLPQGTSNGYLAAGDAITYSVYLEPGQLFSFSLSAPGATSLDPVLDLLDENGLVYNSCHADRSFTGGTEVLSSYDNCYVYDPGTYYLRLSPYSAGGDYVLTVDM